MLLIYEGNLHKKIGAISQLGADKITFPPKRGWQTNGICFYRVALLLKEHLKISVKTNLFSDKKTGKFYLVRQNLLYKVSYFAARCLFKKNIINNISFIVFKDLSNVLIKFLLCFKYFLGILNYNFYS